jgi:hypothetical protein
LKKLLSGATPFEIEAVIVGFGVVDTVEMLFPGNFKPMPFIREPLVLDSGLVEVSKPFVTKAGVSRGFCPTNRSYESGMLE